jgi:hypothetical protein
MAEPYLRQIAVFGGLSYGGGAVRNEKNGRDAEREPGWKGYYRLLKGQKNEGG